MKTYVETCSTGEKGAWGLLATMGATLRPQCPGKGDLLAFYERDLSSWKRARIEKHLSECESCRESIAMMVSFGRASNENASDETSSVSQDVMGAQLSRIAAMAREDEGRQRLSERPGRSKPVLARWSGTAFALPLSNRVLLGTVALLFILLAVPVSALCSPSCQGLCPVCGGNRNLTPCDCEERQRQGESKFAALAKLKS